MCAWLDFGKFVIIVGLFAVFFKEFANFVFQIKTLGD
jgi:hypothetical protein